MPANRVVLAILVLGSLASSSHAQNFNGGSAVLLGTRFSPSTGSGQPLPQLLAAPGQSSALAGPLPLTMPGTIIPGPGMPGHGVPGYGLPGHGLPGHGMAGGGMTVTGIPGAAALPMRSPNAIDTLTAAPTGLVVPGSQGDGSCDGPVGGNGPITYELYARTGPSFLIGSRVWSDSGRTGWGVSGGFRTLYFNRSNDAAWTLDLGVGFTRNGGALFERPVNVTAGELKFANPADTFTIPLGLQGVSRTTFNFGIGRDWWLNGPGVVGLNPLGTGTWASISAAATVPPASASSR